MIEILNQINEMYKEAQKKMHELYLETSVDDLEDRIERLEREVRILRKMIKKLMERCYCNATKEER